MNDNILPMSTNDRTYIHILQDTVIIVVSVIVAIGLVQTDALARLLSSTRELEVIGSFVAGLFFTSIFTTAPAIVALGEISQTSPVWITALVGALGAMTGDLIIFYFIRDRFSEHILELMKHEMRGRRFRALLRMKLFRWLSFFVGGLVIASPFPDEIGIGLMGFSKMKMSWFMMLSFVFNVIGIAIIGLIARALI